MDLNEIRHYAVIKTSKDSYRWRVKIHRDYSHAMHFTIYEHSYPGTEETPGLDVVMEGGVKWDSCSNWRVPHCIHLCYAGQMQDIADVVKICYILTEELLDTWGGYEVPTTPPGFTWEQINPKEE